MVHAMTSRLIPALAILLLSTGAWTAPAKHPKPVEQPVTVESLLSEAHDALGKGDKVELRGFGSFRIRHRNSRKGRNPKTGDAVSVPEKRVPFFKVGKRLRELVNT